MLDFPKAAFVQDQTIPTTASSLRDVLNGLFYYRRLALIVAGVVLAIGILVAVLLPPTYNAEAQLLPLSTGVYEMQDAGRAPQPGQVLDPAAVVNVELQMLDSLELHRALVRQQLGSDATPAQVDAGLERLQANLHVTKQTDANVILLTYSAHDPQTAATTLHDLIALYFQNRANVLTAGRVGFLERQRDQVKKKLDDANAQITAFQNANGIVDIAAQVAGAVEQDDAVRKNKLDTDAALADGRRNLATLRSDARGVPVNVEVYTDNTEAARALGEMQTSLLALQAKRADVASRFMRTAPQVVQLDRQITALKDTIRQQRSSLTVTRRTGRNQFFDSSRDRVAQNQASVDGATARSATLAAQLAASGARLKQLNVIADRLATMKLDRDVLADSFKALSTQVEQARVQLNQTTEAGSPSVRVIEAPTPPSKRSNPPLLLIAGALVAAILIAGSTVFVLGSLRDTFLSPAEVEHALHVPVIAAPLIDEDDGAASERREFRRAVVAIDGVCRNGSTAVLLLSPNSRMSVQQAALGLGRAIARRGSGRVLLLRFATDAPVPATADELQLDRIDGIAAGVIGTAAIAVGRADARLIAALKTWFEYIIVTAPALSEGFEGIELALSVDQVVAVVEAERTRHRVAARLLDHLRDGGSRVAGAIMLGRRSYIPPSIYRLLIDRRPRAA